MDKKKLGLIIGFLIFVIALVSITIIYNNGNKNEKELEQNAASVGIIRVNDNTYEEELGNTDKIVVLDFYENMCPPCTSMIPTLINIAKSSDEITVAMINTSDNDTKKLSKKHEVSATPTIVIMKDDKVIKKFIGATPEETIMAEINKLMEKKDEK